MTSQIKVLLGIFIIAPFLYVASIGPVAYAHARLGWFSDRYLEAIYAPLILLPDTRLIAAPMDAYMELWLGPTGCSGAGPGG